MESVYLKELKSYSISEMMNFGEKYIELLNKRETENFNENENMTQTGLHQLSTEEKIEKKRLRTANESNSSSKKSKYDRKELPALLPIHVSDIRVKQNSEKPVYDVKPGHDVIFLFKVYPPFTYDPNRRHHSVKPSVEIAMLGHQTLNLFCDKIVCNDKYMEVGGDISETPDTPVKIRLGEKHKSRMLYIGNTFYIDRSDPNNIDYSENIREWGKNHDLHFGETLNMHEQTCLDLVARLRYPYVYQHLGGCEHVFKIEYARLVEEKDCLESKLYPFYNYIARSNNPKLCMACMELSQWIVFDSPRMISNPSFLCNSCFRSYHYIDGKKIGTFSAVRYWDCPVFANVFDEVSKEGTSSEK